MLYPLGHCLKVPSEDQIWLFTATLVLTIQNEQSEGTEGETRSESRGI